MIAITPMAIRDWALEAGLKVRIARPKRLHRQAPSTPAPQTGQRFLAMRETDRRKTQWQQTWYAVGGR